MASPVSIPSSSIAPGRGPALWVGLAMIVSAGLAMTLLHGDHFAILTAILLAGAVAAILLWRETRRARRAVYGAEPDRALLFSLVAEMDGAVALVDRAGHLVTANADYVARFGSLSPLEAAIGDCGGGVEPADVARIAWRDGDALLAGGAALRVSRIGTGQGVLLWRFGDLAGNGGARRDRAAALVGGDVGMLLARAGVMALVADAAGQVVAANPAFAARAGASVGAPVAGLIEIDPAGRAYLSAESGENALDLLHAPVDEAEPDAGTLMLLLPAATAVEAREAGSTEDADARLQALLGMLPLGLALVDRDGRIRFMNPSFRRAAGLGENEIPPYPASLVISEDAGVVAEGVRRVLAGRARTTSLVVRLERSPDEPAGLTIAPVQDMGSSAVMLSLKDDGEESRLKRQVAQATKMQAVGQLAGGIAHDFNNILTGILGHCDLMLMRHAPGDSDYDDIQQVKHNANRAASLTRQLLAFSRQQTLRPQVLQLPDIISEISSLLKRLLGETVTLEVSHGRNLGPVRADPGQLEQVIVNLAVNARDAMPQGGTLMLRTFAVPTSEAQKVENDILPAADYTALSVADTGTGIAPEILTKIFEPFFTTKEVGKGTGLGLSTVYGIVKQTGGYIFADSRPGEGTVFTLYFPIHQGEGQVEPVAPLPVDDKAQELWGSGTILLVEDEAMVRAVAERALTRQGYGVLTATNGEEALELLTRLEGEGQRVDLLISDVVMPVMDGPTLVAHARARFPELPILFMSGYAEEQLRNSIDIDNVAFLPKPFSVQQLGEATRAALAGEGGISTVSG